MSTRYWSRQFKKHMETKRAGRMTAVPQLDIPDIFVDDEDDRTRGTPQRSTMAATPRATSKSSDLLSSPDAGRPQHKTWSSSVDIAQYDSSSSHPLSVPRANPSMPGHESRSRGSSFSFEVQESTHGDNSSAQSVSPAQVRDLLDDSVWVESIRRSATIRKSVRKTNWSAHDGSSR